MVLVGPSGCGKSTTLRLVAGLEVPSAGRIHIDNEDVTERAPAARGVAMVFQSYALYPHMTVADNMGFGLRISGVPRAQAHEAMMRAARTLQLEALLERLPRQLSGGQRQRVAIGRAIVRDPKVFLFDEPLSNLDAALRTQMRAELATLHRRLGATIVYVTHDQVEAMTLGARIAVFNGGRIEQVGAPMELYERPCNLFVAGFLGSPRMNLLPLGSAGALAAAAPTATVTLGVRPEHLRWTSGSGLAARVEHVEHLGDAALVHCRVPNVDDSVIVKSVLAPRDLPALLQPIHLTADPDRLHAFDGAGRAIAA
jgi:multiple sugar transport system ATP-binding protein